LYCSRLEELRLFADKSGSERPDKLEGALTMKKSFAIHKSSHERRYGRQSYGGRAVLTQLGSSGFQLGSIADLSPGGCLIRLEQPLALPLGESLEITLQSSYLTLRARGAICHSREEGHLVGICFEGLGDKARQDLRDLIADLARSTAPEPSLV
jgi:hypothetical protein